MKTYINKIIILALVFSCSFGIANASIFSDFFATAQRLGANIPSLPIKNFLGLQDTPSTYTGQAGKVVTVSTSTGALVFTATSSLGISIDTSNLVPYSYASSTFVDRYYASNTFPSFTYASSSYLILDQTTPQTIINGIPLLDATRVINQMHQLVDKAYVDESVTALGQRFYMLSTASGVETYYNTSITPSAEAESSVTATDPIDDEFIAGWISPTGSTPPKLLAGIYEWHIFAAKTGVGNKTFRLYWTLVERKADNSEIVIATSSESDLLGAKADLAVSLTVASDYTPSAGSRIVGKIYVSLVSGISAANVVVYSEGTSDSRWETPTNKEILDTIYAPLASPTFTGTTTIPVLNLSALSSTLLAADANGNVIATTTAASGIALGDLSASVPLLYNNLTGAFSITLASSTADGYLSSADWSTFNSKQAAGSYLTAEADPIWMAASSSYYLASNPSNYISSYNETDPIWLAASSSYLTIASAGTTYPTFAYASSSYVLPSALSAYLSTTTAASTYAPLTSPTFATSINGSYFTASEMVITDGSKNIVSAPVATYPSLTELSYVKGLSSAVQTQIGGKLGTSLTSAQVFVGNGSNIATGVAVSGDATMANTGALTIANDVITLAKMATGTDGNLITYDTAGDPAYVATGDSGQVLTSNGAGAAPTFQTAAGGGANTALSNLSSVAINTSLVSDTDNTDDLGTTVKKWANLFITTIGATATRVTKGWFTDLEVTNAIAGSVTGNAGTVTNATFTTALTVNTGTVTLTGNVANSSALTIGAGAVSVSGSNTGDQNLSAYLSTTTASTTYVPYSYASSTFPSFSYASSTFATGTNYWSANGTNVYKNNSGNVGIGTTTPTTALSVIGTTTTNGLNISGLSNTFLAVDANSNVIATTSPAGGSSGTSKFIPKGSTQIGTTTSLVVQNDNELKFSILSGETWVFKFFLQATNSNNTQADWKSAILGASGWSCQVVQSGIEPLGTVFPQYVSTDCDDAPATMPNSVISADVNIPFQVYIQGWITATSDGEVILQWGANTVAGPIDVLKGSYVVAQKVGGAGY